MQRKKCRNCQKTKPITDFYKRWYITKRGCVYCYKGNCRQCLIIDAQKRYVYNKERIRASHLKQNFGISLKEYNRVLQNQNGVCDICGLAEINKNKKHLSIDHDHETSRVRGLLCSKCNLGLGAFGDDIDVMASAISYLINHKIKKVG